MKRFLFLCIVLFPFFVIGQPGFLKGYIITYDNDTIFGKIKDSQGGVNDRNYLYIRFLDESGNITKYSAYDIKGYRIGHFIKYRSIQLQLKYFAVVIIEGPLLLLSYDQFPQSQNAIGEPVFYSSHLSGRLYLLKDGSEDVTCVRKSKFSKRMSEYFKDYPELSKKIKNKSLQYSDIIKIVKMYNEFIQSKDSKEL